MSDHEPQKPPHPGQIEVIPAVIADLEARSEAGKIKYGTALYTENGRDALVDLYQELLDAVCYLKQRLLEDKNQTDLREALADLCHEQWSGWMRHLFSKCGYVTPSLEDRNNELTEGEAIIPLEFVKRWRRQLSTPYADLSEEEKDSDRKEADKFIAFIALLRIRGVI